MTEIQPSETPRRHPAGGALGVMFHFDNDGNTSNVFHTA